MIIQDIASPNLHDSHLVSITVRTTDEGDENISLRLNYLNDYQSFETTPKLLVFDNCWGAVFNANFRAEGPDSILSAEEVAESDFITEILEKYARVNLKPNIRLRHFVIKTSLTGSRLEVVSEKARLMDVPYISSGLYEGAK